MQKPTLLNLASAKVLSYFDPCFQGYSIRQCHSLASLKNFLTTTPTAFILTEFECTTARHVEAFQSLRAELKGVNPALNLIVFTKTIETSLFQKYARSPSLLLVTEAEKKRAAYFASKFLQGNPVYLRSSERQTMAAPVMVKSTDWTKSPVPGVQTKGHFIDFAQQGARLYLPQRSFRVKDYISVLYQSQNKEWITVESQLRWEAPTPEGGQMLGIQFLAIA